jgi:uncharacterized membrane protein (UPF0136 family)
MAHLTTLQKVAALLAAVYGMTAMVGGTIGYLKADSVASLVAGGVSGILLIAGAGLVFVRPGIGLGLAILVSLGLVGRFASVVIRTQDIGVVAIIMISDGLLVIVISLLAMLKRR